MSAPGACFLISNKGRWSGRCFQTSQNISYCFSFHIYLPADPWKSEVGDLIWHTKKHMTVWLLHPRAPKEPTVLIHFLSGDPEVSSCQSVAHILIEAAHAWVPAESEGGWMDSWATPPLEQSSCNLKAASCLNLPNEPYVFPCLRPSKQVDWDQTWALTQWCHWAGIEW